MFARHVLKSVFALGLNCLYVKLHSFVAMKSYLVVGVSIVAYLFAPSVAQSQQNGNCTVFDWDQQPGYLTNSTTEVRVSAAATCQPKSNETHDCPITAAGDAQASFTYNVSTTLRNVYWQGPSSAESFLHNLILNAVNSSLDGATWPDYAVGLIDTTQALSPGTSGYINFAALQRCFEGTMSNCTGELEDGLAIRACAPVLNPARDGNRIGILSGRYSIVEIPEEQVTQYRDPYAGQLSSDASERLHRGTTVTLAMSLAVAFAAAMM